MKFYIEVIIKSYAELSKIVSTIHCSNYNFGLYFDGINKVRCFADNKKALQLHFAQHAIKSTPETTWHIMSERISSVDRRTPRQREKRLIKLKQHLAKKGIEYKSDGKEPKMPDYDYFINMKSISTGKSYRLYVKSKLTREEKNGLFSSYGLSLNQSTVPYF